MNSQRSFTFRSGFTLIELLVVIVVIAIMIALLLPAVQQAREAARRAQCRNNLKQLGIALHSYHSTHGGFPPGIIGGPPGEYTAFSNANVQLLPYLEQANLHDLVDPDVSWFMNRSEIARTIIPVFICPSNSKVNPREYPIPALDAFPIGKIFAMTDYIYCKGADDAWCWPFDGAVRPHAGVFEANRSTRARDITDGMTNTMLMGEGAGGKHWPLCHGAACTTPYSGAIGEIPASNMWIVGNLGNPQPLSLGLLLTGSFGCTVEKPNKCPVTDTYFDYINGYDCRRSTEGGPHTTANFRSDHKGGVMFLFGDGSVHFLSENVDMQAYQALSTMADGEVVRR